MSLILYTGKAPRTAPSVFDALRRAGQEIVPLPPTGDALAASAGSAEADVVVIPAGDEEPLALARAAHAAHPTAHIVFFTDESQEELLRRALSYAPGIGDRWSVLRESTPEQTAAAIDGIATNAMRRRQLRTTLTRANRVLAEGVRRPLRSPVVSDHFLAATLNQIGDAVVLLEASGHVITFNKAARTMFGALLRSGADFNEVLREATGSAPEAIAGGTAEGIELGFRSSSKALVEFHSVVVNDDSGRRAGTAVVARDIAPRREHEWKRNFLSELGTKLGSTLDLSAALQSVAEAVVAAIGDVCVIDAIEGDAMKRLAAAVARPEDRDSGDALLRHSAKRRRHPALEALRRGETIVRNDVGREEWKAMAESEEHARLLESLQLAAFITTPLRGGDQTIGALSVGRRASSGSFSDSDVELIEDIARLAASALHNAWLYHLADTANRAKDEFLATLSHELRTPMTSILGWIQVLRLGALDPEAVGEGLASMERSARVQAQLIDDLLDLSRIQMGKLQLQMRPVDLTKVVRAAADTIGPAARAKEIAVTLDLPASALLPAGDPNRLQQVVWNLLSNAIKFTERGGSVEVRLERSESNLALVVRDTGRGIEPDFLPYVFERFRQADSATTRQYGGLGLGLAIVKQIVEMHGGSVAAASAGTGKGATFTVSLPITTAAIADAQDDSLTRLPDLHAVDVLVVDDDDSAASVIAAILRRAGAEVRIEASVGAALEALRQRIPDVLISDVAMPGEDGFTLIESVRQTLRLNHERLPAIALTALGDTNTRVRLLGAGFQRHLRKPVDVRELTSTVRQLASERKS
jgi:signal transduction histidine kinase/DNA-binding NarL/FixJ family response regulator